MSFGFSRAASAMLMLAASVLTAEAQQPETKPPSGKERCQPGQGSEQDGGTSGYLSRKLDDCDGVLQAPPTGDPDMVEPAPETGGGRVINPDTLPDGANPSNGSGG